MFVPIGIQAESVGQQAKDINRHDLGRALIGRLAAPAAQGGPIAGRNTCARSLGSQLHNKGADWCNFSHDFSVAHRSKDGSAQRWRSRDKVPKGEGRDLSSSSTARRFATGRT